MIPALVLTAGRGSRLDPLTRLVAKPAVPLGDRSLIERVLGWLARQQFRDVVLNLHHRPATITTIVGDGTHLGLSVRYSWEQPLLGSAGGPRRALPLMRTDEFAIVNGDTLCDFDLRPMIDAHRRSSADVTMAVLPNSDPNYYNGIVIDDKDAVTGFVTRGQAAGSWHFIGVQIANARIFQDVEDGVPTDTIAGIYRDVIRSAPGRIRVWRATTSFVDVGTPRDYLRAALQWPPGGDAAAGAGGTSRLVRSILWPGATLASGVDLEDCVVIGGAWVPTGFRARAAVLAPAALVGPDDHAEIRDGVAVFAMD
jgi:mannose-1-phosphate guanylyltransferase